MPVVDKDLAGDETVGTSDVIPLYAGDAPIVTADFVVDAGNLAKYTVMGKITATGKVIVLTPGASDGSQFAFGILSQPVDATGGDVTAALFTAGFFNHAALIWPAALDTLVERQVAFDGTMIQIGKVSLS
jgi:hypothetical protein